MTSPDDPLFKKHSVLFFYRAGKTVHEALIELNKVFPTLTFQEIDAWFAQFRGNDFDLTKDVEIVETQDTAKFDSLPLDVAENVIRFLNAGDLKSMRLVQKAFLSLIDEKDCIINNILISMTMSAMEIRCTRLASSKTIRIFDRGVGCRVEKDGATQHFVINFFAKACEEFRLLCEKSETKLVTLKIKCEKGDEHGLSEKRRQFIQHFHSTMDGLKISAQNINLLHITQADCLRILDCIQTGSVTSLRLYRHLGTDDEEAGLFSESPHWPFLKYVNVTAKLRDPMSCFLHIPNVFAFLHEGSDTPESIFNYANAISQSNDLKKQIFFMNSDRDAIRHLFSSYGFEDIQQTVTMIPMANGKRMKFENKNPFNFRAL